MTSDPLDPTEQAAFRELDQLRRLDPNPFACKPGCICQQDDAMTTPLDLNDIE